MKSLLRGIPVAAFALLSFPALAGAVADPCDQGASSVPAAGCVTEVEAVTLEPAPVAPSASPAVVPAVAGKQQLPVTGGDAAKLIVVGGALVAAGAVLTTRSRRVGESA